MIKYNEFLQESLQEQKIKEEIHSFLKSMPKAELKASVLYRGMSESSSFGLKTPRLGRQPKDTPPLAHDALNKAFKDKFGNRLRSNSVFCTSNWDQASGYGNNMYIIVPKDAKLYASKK